MSGAKKPLNRADMKRVEQLQKQLELKESKLNSLQSKLKKQQKDLESDERKLATQKKQFANERKQLKQDKQFLDKNSTKNLQAGKQQRPFSAQKSRKLKEDYTALKKKHEHFAKLMRDYKKKADQLAAENAVLRRRVANNNNKKLPTNDKQLRSLMKENRWLKKKLREMMKELRKQKRWYSRVVKVFKDNQNKWVQKKIEAYKDKQYIIKYVFVDDIKRIVLTRPGHERNGFKGRVRFKNGRGGQILLRNVGIDVFDQKVRKRDRKGKRDRRGGNGGKGRNGKDVITKTRPGKDGKNIIKTKYVDKGDTDTTTKEKAGKKGDKKGGKNGKGGDADGSNKKGKKGKNKGGSGSGSDGDDDGDDADGKNKKRKKRGSKADAATSEFLQSGGTTPATPSDDKDGDGDYDDVGDADGDDIDEDEWDTLDDPQDALDDYMVEFLTELGIAGVTKDNVDSKMDEDEAGGDADEDDDKDDDAQLDKEFQNALKSDKDLMFDGDEDGSPELQAQIMYLMGEMDSRTDDLNKLKQISDGVQYLSKPDATGNEEDMEEKELNTTKEKLDAMDLVFVSMKQRQDAFLSSLEELNCDTDALRPINENWYDQYHLLAQMALTGGGDGEAKAKKNFEKLRYFIDYFMKELVGRMYDLRCINTAYYNQDINFDENGAMKEPTGDGDGDDDDSKTDDRPPFDVLQSGIDGRHSELHDTVSKDDVMNADNSEDAVGGDIEAVLTDFLGNIDDWKSLIAESRTKHETWIDTRGSLLSAMAQRHTEMGELMNKINDVPSYTMNLQKWEAPAPETENNSGTDDSGVDDSGADEP